MEIASVIASYWSQGWKSPTVRLGSHQSNFEFCVVCRENWGLSASGGLLGWNCTGCLWPLHPNTHRRLTKSSDETTTIWSEVPTKTTFVWLEVLVTTILSCYTHFVDSSILWRPHWQYISLACYDCVPVDTKLQLRPGRKQPKCPSTDVKGGMSQQYLCMQVPVSTAFKMKTFIWKPAMSKFDLNQPQH